MSGNRVNFPLPSLINGVSQQSPAFRLTSQCEIQDNAISSVVNGVSKRPPTKHAAKLSTTPFGDVYVHTINRDMNERYVVVLRNGNLQVFDMLDSGREVTVNFPEGKGYLVAASPRQAFRMTSVNDYSFIVNRTITVRMDSTEPPEVERNEAVAYVKKGIIATTYKVMVNGKWVSFTTPEAASTVSSTSGGTSSHLYVEPWSWSWSVCYGWLHSNGQTIPIAYSPDQWSPEEIVGFHGHGWAVTNSPDVLRWIKTDLDKSNETLQANYNYYLALGNSIETKYITRLMNFKRDMQTYVYNISVSLVNAGYQTSVATTINTGSQPSTDVIAANLAAAIQTTIPGFTVDVIGSSLRIRKTDGADFQFAVTDSWGNEALVGIKREVQKFTDLPARCWDGFRIRVTGENPTKDDDYYLEYSSDNFYKNGVWKETRGWNQKNSFNPATMPHTLIREANGTFTFESAPWKERRCGDDHSVPVPSFADSRIEDVTFYRNRLGFISDENLILSMAGEYFQFWPASATRVEDTDPIDSSSSNAAKDGTVHILRSCTVFGENLMLSADQIIYQVTAGGNAYLSPTTCKIDPVVSYECSPLCHPVSVSQAMYFVTADGQYSGLREYFVGGDATTSDAPSVTTHAPSYLPKTIFKMTASVNDGLLFLLSGETPNIVYVYRYYWMGEEKVQSAWCRWIFAEGDKVLNLEAISSTLHMVAERADGVYLESIDLNSAEETLEVGYPVLLDRKCRVRGTYTTASDTTTWTLPYAATLPNFAAVCGQGFPASSIGSTLKGYSVLGAVLSKPGRYDYDIIAGVEYVETYRFSEQFYRESRESGASVILEGRLQLLKFSLAFQNSGYFQIRVRSGAREPITYEHLPKIGSPGSFLDKPFIESATFKAPVQAKADRVTIDIVNPLHYPLCFQSAEWVGTFNVDARRI